MSNTFKRLLVPEGYRHYWSKYPEGYTILEALLNWVDSVNQLTENVNDWNIYLEDFVENFDEKLRPTVQDMLNEMENDGRLAQIINEEIFSWKADKTYVDNQYSQINTQINGINTQLAYMEVEVERFGAVGDGITDDSQAFRDGFAYVAEHHLTLSTQRGKTYLIDDVIVEGKNNFGFNSKGILKRPDNLAKPPTPTQATKTILFRDCRNFYIPEIHLDGNHYNNHCFVGPSQEGLSPTTGYNQGGYGQEWRHSLVFHGCEDFKVDYINVLNPSGDGVSFSRETYRGIIGDIYGKSLDQYENPVDLGRNLVTITNGVKDLQINSITSLNVGHYYEPGGLDIEPDDFDMVSNTSVENIYINNVHVLTGGSGGVGIFDNYNNEGIRNIVINNVYVENHRDNPSFPLLIAGAKDVTIHNAHCIEHSMRGYAVQIGRQKNTKNIYLPNVIAEGGMLGLFMQGNREEYETNNVEIGIEFRNTRDNMIHFFGKNSDIRIDIKGGSFESPDNISNNRVVYFSGETNYVKGFTLSGKITHDKTNGGKRLIATLGSPQIEELLFENLDITGWWEYANSVMGNVDYRGVVHMPSSTEATVINSKGWSSIDKLRNAVFTAIKGLYATNTNPIIQTDDDDKEYVVKGWYFTKHASFIFDGDPVEDRLYINE